MRVAMAERFGLKTDVLNRVHDFLLRLPPFPGKAKIESRLRAKLSPHVYEIRYGFRMELDAQEWPQIDLRAARCLEPCTSALFERLLRFGGTCVDVGAHVGYHALLARHLVGETGRVYAIDPQPHNCAKLLRNAELNDFSNIVVIAAAAGASEDWIVLKAQSPLDRSRLTLNGPGVNDGMLTFVAPIISLARLFKMQDISRVDVLKIDVEGFELEVLEGAGDALGAVNNVVLEVLPDCPEERQRAIEQTLRSRGFRIFDVLGGAWQPRQRCAENNLWARRP